MVSRRVTRRVRAAESILSAIRQTGPEAARRLEEEDAVHLRDGEDPVDYEQLFQFLTRRLESRIQSLIEADQALESELADDPGARKERDEAAAELSDIFVLIRRRVRSIFDLEGERLLLGTEGDTEDVPSMLLYQVETALKLLKDKGSTALPSLEDTGIQVDPSVWIAQLEGPAERLRQALEGNADELREAQQARARQQEALLGADQSLKLVALVVEGLFRSAGLDELADRLRHNEPDSPAIDEPEAASVQAEAAPEAS